MGWLLSFKICLAAIFPKHFYREPEISQCSKSCHWFSLFCEIKFLTKQFDNVSDVVPLVEWDFHLRSAKAYVAPLSLCLARCLWRHPGIMFLLSLHFTLLQQLPPCFAFSSVVSMHENIFLTRTALPLVLRLDSFVPNKIYRLLIIFQSGKLSQNTLIRRKRWFIPNLSMFFKV